MSEQTTPGNGVDPAPPVPDVQGLPPPDNIMLHGFRELTPAQERQLREFKDLALMMWNDLHMADGSSAERRTFDHRELGFAAIKLEETVLWVEKFYAL